MLHRFQRYRDSTYHNSDHYRIRGIHSDYLFRRNPSKFRADILKIFIVSNINYLLLLRLEADQSPLTKNPPLTKNINLLLP